MVGHRSDRPGCKLRVGQGHRGNTQLSWARHPAMTGMLQGVWEWSLRLLAETELTEN